MCDVSFAIQSHPSRSALAAALAERLPGSTVVVDPDPDGYRSPWRTYRRVLQEFSRENASHVCVLQDDVELCRSFADVVPRVARARPDTIVALYVGGIPRTGRDAIYRACERDESFALLHPGSWIPAVALLWPTVLMEPVLAWIDKRRWPPKYHADDEMIGRAAGALGIHAVATVPSLVQHPDVIPSIAGNGRRAMAGRNPDRVAACFIHPDCDPLAIDW